METASSSQGFSVDFLLGELAASAAQSASPNDNSRLLQAAQKAQLQAEQAGDFGTTLITQVEQYLTEAADDLEQFTAIVQQLGDMCVDHSIEHEMVGESEQAAATTHTSQHSHGGGSHNHKSHSSHHTKPGKKRKSKKRQRRSFLDLYLQRLAQQKI
ncbi:MAG TPA: hypothetical protein VJ843_03865 [Candidatus Saccharimonadales bacterium]|nr:hypothetical protein [Candidatus Saccharimonadales bacterium]